MAARFDSGPGAGVGADTETDTDHVVEGGSRSSRRARKEMRRRKAMEARWKQNRYAVPYRSDGPKVTLGVLWFLAVAGSVLIGFSSGNTLLSAIGLAVVGAVVAGLAALQTGFAWLPRYRPARGWMVAAAAVAALPGVIGPLGVIIGLVVGALVVAGFAFTATDRSLDSGRLMAIGARSALPAGLAMASLAAITRIEPSGLNLALALILMVSAYEAGDYLVGTGSNNAFEGPLAGTVALGVVTFFLFLVSPEPFTPASALIYGAITALCCPLGQVAASALLPHGAAWAPALRRVDSYLIAAPLWLVLAAIG